MHSNGTPSGPSPLDAGELSLEQFERVAAETLDALVEAILAVSESLDADLQSGVLTLSFEDGGPRYVINSHRAAKQIWMAAERVAWHFDFDPRREQWVATQSGDELWATVQQVLARRLGEAVSLR